MVLCSSQRSGSCRRRIHWPDRRFQKPMNNTANIPAPGADALAHSRRLEACICKAIADQGGAISFRRFMEMALYEPGLGYYVAGQRRFGAAGDFVTAPELGALFARCLARQIEDVAATLDSDWVLLEIGAGNGSLARDLLRALPQDRLPARYEILERSASLKAVQAETLTDAPVPVSWLDQPPDTPWQGVLIANEVMDALPVERFRFMDSALQQQVDVSDDDELRLDYRQAPAALEERLDRLQSQLSEPLPEGFTSELCTELPAWLQAVTDSMERGLSLWVDYGYPRDEYYAPERTMGTLIGHYRHRVMHDPLRWPGLQDLTASVDFTAVAEAADRCGLELAGYTTQANFLLGLGITELIDQPDLDTETRLRLSAEIKQLMLPGEMGERFQVMALSRGLEPAFSGFDFRDLSHRL